MLLLKNPIIVMQQKFAFDQRDAIPLLYFYKALICRSGLQESEDIYAFSGTNKASIKNKSRLRGVSIRHAAIRCDTKNTKTGLSRGLVSCECSEL